MYNKEIVVRCESGLHNRQATYFVQKANEFECSIWLDSGSRKAGHDHVLSVSVGSELQEPGRFQRHDGGYA